MASSRPAESLYISMKVMHSDMQSRGTAGESCISNMWAMYCWGLVYRSDALRVLLLCWSPTPHEHLQECAVRKCSKPYQAFMLWHPRTRPDSQLMLCMQGACWMHRMREGF